MLQLWKMFVPSMEYRSQLVRFQVNSSKLCFNSGRCSFHQWNIFQRSFRFLANSSKLCFNCWRCSFHQWNIVRFMDNSCKLCFNSGRCSFHQWNIFQRSFRFLANSSKLCFNSGRCSFHQWNIFQRLFVSWLTHVNCTAILEDFLSINGTSFTDRWFPR